MGRSVTADSIPLPRSTTDPSALEQMTQKANFDLLKKLQEPGAPEANEVERLRRKAQMEFKLLEQKRKRQAASKDFQGAYDKLKRIDKEQKRKEEAKKYIGRLLELAKTNAVMSPLERAQVQVIQALGKVRREGWEVLRLFARNGDYDMDNLTGIFNLFEDYVLRRDRFPMLPTTPNPVVDRRISRVYYTLLVQFNEDDPVSRLDSVACGQDADLMWNTAPELKEVSKHKTGLCMRKLYHRPVGPLAPMTVTDIWDVLDARPFLNM